MSDCKTNCKTTLINIVLIIVAIKMFVLAIILFTWTREEPPFHLAPDMDHQPKMRAQAGHMMAPPEGGPLLVLSLFLLGYGWNLGFVAGSALISEGVEHAERTRAQGFTDTITWGSSAVASLASGFILASLGFEALGALGLALVGLGALAILRLRRDVSRVATAS
jgi:MFS family permease